MFEKIKTKLFLVVIFVVMIFFVGCRGKSYVEIKDFKQFNSIDASKITAINVLSTSDRQYWNEPEKWTVSSLPVFPITEPKKIIQIMNYIRNSNAVSPQYSTTDLVICFKQQGNRVYFIGIYFDLDKVRGAFWESMLLKEYLNELEFPEPSQGSADSNSLLSPILSFPSFSNDNEPIMSDEEAEKFMFKDINSEDPNEKVARKATLDKMQKEVERLDLEKERQNKF